MTPSAFAMIAVAATLVLLIVVDLTRPARRFETVRGWRRKGVFFMLLVVAVGAAAPALLGPLVPFTLLPGHRLGVAGGAVVGIVVSELFVYWIHRLNHRVGFLWRWVHQLHHSSERMDVFGSAYFHPFELLQSAALGVLIGSGLLGLDPEALALVGAWQAFNGFFGHGNIETPTWLGYLVSRPEQHGVHHQRGVHAFNYANLPLWDLVFGTFKNPREWETEAGFYPGASQRLVPMLLGRDISMDQPSRTREVEAAEAAKALANAA